MEEKEKGVKSAEAKRKVARGQDRKVIGLEAREEGKGG